MRLENWFITNPDVSQQEVLKVSIDQNLVVKGAAGSGKTNMAIYRANLTGENSFVIVVYTVSLEKMIRFGLGELGLDKDRVVHEWSWINRGIRVSGDVFCLRNSDNGLFRDLLILKTLEGIKFFVTKEKYDDFVKSEIIANQHLEDVEHPFDISIDFDDWVEERFYRTFLRRQRWFRQVHLPNFVLDLNDDNLVLIPAGYLFKNKGVINYVIVDEGQDFSVSNYKQSFIPQAKKSVSIFGDTNQRVYKDRYCNIEDIAKTFDYKLLNLDYNYRVPKTIARVAQTVPQPNLDLLENNKKNNGNSEYPIFPKPIIKKCDSAEDELKFILSRINNDALDDVAILVPTENMVKQVYEFLANNNMGSQVRLAMDIGTTSLGNRKFRRIDTLDFTNQDLPSILTYHSSKGTEFDNVFIPFANNDSGLSRNPLYVALTRSSHRLFISYSSQLTSLLQDVNMNDVQSI